MHEGFPFSPPTELLEPISATSTSLRVKDPNMFPDAPNQATLGVDENGETVLYTTKVGDMLGGLTRGYDQKNGYGEAKSWSDGTTISCNFTNAKQAAMQENIANSVQTTPQTLTAPQQAQARQNIGLEPIPSERIIEIINDFFSNGGGG